MTSLACIDLTTTLFNGKQIATTQTVAADNWFHLQNYVRMRLQGIKADAANSSGFYSVVINNVTYWVNE